MVKPARAPVRIFLANQPRMVRQMLRRAIQRIPNLSVVGESNRTQSVMSAPRMMAIDWLVVSLTEAGEIPDHFLNLAKEYPSIRVLGISLDGNELELKDEATGQKRHLQNVSLKTLISLFQKTYIDQQVGTS